MADTTDTMKARWEKAEAEGKGATVALAGITPHLMVRDGAGAIDFYIKAFGATEQHRMFADDGKRIMHAALTLNGTTLMLNDDFPEMRDGAPLGEPSGVTLHLQVDDVDRWHKRAVDAGATATMPPTDMFWGDRYGQVRDPFGHSWSIATSINK